MRLFHYTDINAIKSILTERKIWFTDLRYMNDSSELKDGISTLMQAFKRWRGSLWAEKSYIKSAKKFIKEELDAGFLEQVHCACSFSHSCDQLSQWRSYGKYILEFDQELLLNDLDKLHVCIYDKKIKEDKALIAITKSVEVISKDMSQSDGCISVASLDQVSSLYELAATFKNEGFKEENEVRAILKMDDTDENILYRTRADLMIPYCEIPISLDSIKAVHVGPMHHQDLAFNSLWGFVRSVEKNYQEETGNIEFEIDVIQSTIPFRTL